MEELKRKLRSAQDLQSVVRTMKALAAVSIHQYERAVESLADYSGAVRLGLQALLRGGAGLPQAEDRPPRAPRLGLLAFGSDQGMCGQLNEQILSHALGELERRQVGPEALTLWAVGERVAARFQDAELPPRQVFAVPGSVAGITPAVQEVLLTLEAAHARRQLHEVLLVYSRHETGAVFHPETLRFLPVDLRWAQKLQATPWPTRKLPLFTMERDRLFSALIHEYLFVELYRAFAESLASENASRLASMQNAERNIEERLAELTQQYHQVRQAAITGELLDIVAGFEALRES